MEMTYISVPLVNLWVFLKLVYTRVECGVWQLLNNLEPLFKMGIGERKSGIGRLNTQRALPEVRLLLFLEHLLAVEE
ncbi:MAG: hypothetical protein DRQ54_10940 [Gammaproteobacteria bacterium]|nr:MAG: hypothetical protein DRQ54_10940 [Gammaproteobacteria bacterium]RLA11459.1 MAG: hypothetical protein DRQ52_09620 [Gammaproteobacteria bacterium]